MRTKLAALVAVLVLTAAGMAGFIAWQVRGYEKERPQVSVYTHGTLLHVSPYRFCDVALTKCDPKGQTAELRVNAVDRVQLSIPKEIASSPWELVRVYVSPTPEGPQIHRGTLYRGGNWLAVTVPTVDPSGLRLAGLEIQLPTAGINQHGEEEFRVRAAWSIATVWD